MGKVIVNQVILRNNDDYRDFSRGHIEESAIRMKVVDMIADTGARFVGLPESLIKELGLTDSRKIKLRLADGSVKDYPLYEGLRVQIDDRESIFDCVAKPEDAPLLLGQMVLEGLDYVVDCPNNRIIPNPEAPEGMMLVDDF